MSDKKFTVSPGDEIIITVPKRQPTANQILMRRPPAPKAMVRPRRAVESFPRRLKKDGLLNIYDLGYLKNLDTGIYEDTNYYKLTSSVFLGDSDPRMSLADFTAFYNTFTSIDPADWKNRFWRWDYANAKKYKMYMFFVFPGGVDGTIVKFQPDDADWTESGIKMKPAFQSAEQILLLYPIELGVDEYAISTYGFSHNLSFRGQAAFEPVHITNIFDRNAPSAEIDFTGKIDIFLVPTMTRSTGISTRSSPTASRYLNDLYTPLPRRVTTHDETSPYYEMPVINYGYANGAGIPPSPHTEFKRAVDFSKTLPGARAFDITNGYSSASPIDIDNFPGWVDDAVNASGNIHLEIIEEASDNLGNYIPNSSLKAIVVRNDSQFYYLW